MLHEALIGRTVGPIAVFAVRLAMPPSALAKGPSLAVIEGPGIGPTPVRPSGSSTIGPALATMVDASRFFAGLDGDRSRRFLNHDPAKELGPRYVVTYTLNGPDEPSTITQYVFPYAAPRSVTYMPQGQRFWEGEETTGGWFVATASLKRMLLQVGLPKVPPSETARTTTTAPVGPIAVPVIVIVLAATTTLWLTRFRLRPP